MTSSLRRRILVGSILWTAGMVLLSSAAFTVAIERYPSIRFPLVAHVHGFLQMPAVLAIGGLCLAGGVLQVRRGLARLDDLRRRLVELRAGRDRRLDGDYPAEVRPLVADLNVLLEHRDAAIQRALAKAADLAHGLKTPLAILTHEADALAGAGHDAAADEVRQQVERMRRQVDYHLAHARAAASGSTVGARSSVRDAADGLARALARLHAERGLAIEIEVPAELSVRVQREDLDEMLGNLLDNACTWCRARVRVSAWRAGDGVAIAVDDDGPGLADALREAVLRRGVRVDEASPGSGLGLAIVGDLAELYGGSIVLERSPLGGCRARLDVP